MSENPKGEFWLTVWMRFHILAFYASLSPYDPHGYSLGLLVSQRKYILYSLNTVKHKYLFKILVPGSLILCPFRQHVSVVERPSSGLQWTKNITCVTFYILSEYILPSTTEWKALKKEKICIVIISYLVTLLSIYDKQDQQLHRLIVYTYLYVSNKEVV
jgi:hypothetical protein